MLKPTFGAILIVAIAAASVAAQPPPFRRGVLGLGANPGPVPQMTLIHNAAIRDELKFTKEQREKVDALTRERMAAIEGIMAAYAAKRSLPGPAAPETNDVLMMDLQVARNAIHEQTDKAILEILTPAQRERLGQLRAQAEGPFAFKRPEFVEELGLAPEQIEPILDVVEEGRLVMWETSTIPLGGRPGEGPLTLERMRALEASDQFKENLEKGRKATLEVRAETLRAIEGLLTPEQRDGYRKRLGPPFDFAKAWARPAALPAKAAAPPR